MGEFVFKSRKNGTHTPSFSLERLEKPAESQSLELIESKVGCILPGKTTDPAADLNRLRSLYAAGRLRGLKLELPGRPPIYDLQSHLSRLHSRTLSDADRAELGEIAALVSRLPFLGVS